MHRTERSVPWRFGTNASTGQPLHSRHDTMTYCKVALKLCIMKTLNKSIKLAFLSSIQQVFLFMCVTVNGNGHSIGALNKHSPESGSSWLEEGCNGFGPLRFSSPGSGLSGISSSILSATSESGLSGYSTERSLLSPNSTYSALSC